MFTLLFFSVSGSKQGKYLLPAAPAIIALSLLAVRYLSQRFDFDAWQVVRRWSLGLVCVFSALIIFIVPFYSSQIGGVAGYAPIKEQIEKEPGRLVHFHRPRSLTLYELGAPMSFVRSARELYTDIAAGKIVAGDYVLLEKDLLSTESRANSSLLLTPYPHPASFEFVLETRTEKAMVLLRIVPGARYAGIPETPEPPVLHWRDEMFDTD